MEKNYWIALVLSMAVLLGYPFFLKKISPPAPQIETADVKIRTPESVPSAPLAISVPEKKTEAEMVSYSSNLYDLKFSTQGATIADFLYKGEKAKMPAPVPFYSENPAGGIFAVKILNQEIDLSKAVFQLLSKDGNEITFAFEKAGEFRLLKKYTMDEQRPVISLNLLFENLSSRERVFPAEIDYALYYGDSSAAHHVDVESVFFQEKVKGKKMDGIRKKGFSVSGGIEWSGLLKKYFAVIAKPDWPILSQENSADDQVISTSLRMDPVTVAPGGTKVQNVFIFAGPQRYETLKSLKMDFDLLLSRGFFGLFKIWLLIALKFLNQFTHNFGYAIILLTIGLKIVFSPMTHMSFESMRKMQAIQPKMKSIQERHKGDPTKMNREVMELYRRNKVNPMGGCLPMVAQIPIFIAFYQVLNETIELKGAPFAFWIHDLAEPDKLFTLPFTIPFLGSSFHLLPIFMALSMLWQQKVTPQATTSPEQAQIMKFMPIMMGVILYSMPSGLALYWFVNNMLTVGHQLIVKRMGAVILHHEDRD